MTNHWKYVFAHLEPKVNSTTTTSSCKHHGHIGHIEVACYDKHGLPSTQDNKN